MYHAPIFVFIAIVELDDTSIIFEVDCTLRLEVV